MDAAIVVAIATTDRPRITRAWGPRVAGREMILCVEAPSCSGLRDDIVVGGQIAATLARPSTYSSVQLKGPIVTVREPTADELRHAHRHCDGFVADIESMGLDRRPAVGLFDPSALVAVSFEAAYTYDETPGPEAGMPIDADLLLGGG